MWKVSLKAVASLTTPERSAEKKGHGSMTPDTRDQQAVIILENLAKSRRMSISVDEPSTPLQRQRYAEADALDAGAQALRSQDQGYQQRVRQWVLECFNPIIADDMTERSFRFLEEALELCQSIGCTREQAARLVEYVYGREAGRKGQEVGGVMVTLAALCSGSWSSLPSGRLSLGTAFGWGAK